MAPEPHPIRSRPASLLQLFEPVTALPGLGPAGAKQLARLTGRDPCRRIDLLLHIPRLTQTFEAIADLGHAREGSRVILEARITQHRPPPRTAVPWRIATTVGDRTLDLVFFRHKGLRLSDRLPEGAACRLRGRLGRFNDRWQMVHPEILETGGGSSHHATPLYASVPGLQQTRLRRMIEAATSGLAVLPEWIAPSLLAERDWPAFHQALADVHAAEPAARQARERLAFDELLAHQVAMLVGREVRERKQGRSRASSGRLVHALEAILPFEPTSDQRTALAEIAQDMRRPAPMSRLLQGDVGSGKTLVAFQAMLIALEAGDQAALMAPTDLLARQHYRTMEGWARGLGIEIALLAGSLDRAERNRVLESLASGAVRLVVGTHALFQKNVAFDRLGLAVIDEQHRFGVAQRLSLLDKGASPDLLLTTATPIPRTGILALYGDIGVSCLREKPAGRIRIETRTIPRSRETEVIEACGRALLKGERVYWICPTIDMVVPDGEDEADQPDDSPLISAEARFAILAKRFGSDVGLAHGRMPAPAREAVLASFAAGEISLLVATTVVEVGVDVPQATVMVIDHAERFGLAQLHQLRGRVGRGSLPSHCLLLYGPSLGRTARRRLGTLRSTDDGFVIAEADLELRGPGEVLGTRQSGLPEFKIADLASDKVLLDLARDHAAGLAGIGSDRKDPSTETVQILLHLFERFDALTLLEAG